MEMSVRCAYNVYIIRSVIQSCHYWQIQNKYSFTFIGDFRKEYITQKCELYKKKKAVPLQAWSGPEGSRNLRFPDFMTTTQDGGKVVSLMHRPS